MDLVKHHAQCDVPYVKRVHKRLFPIFSGRPSPIMELHRYSGCIFYDSYNKEKSNLVQAVCRGSQQH